MSRASDCATQQVAARTGPGCVLLRCLMGDVDPELARVAPADPDLGLGLWLIVHHDLRSAPRVRAMIDFLVNLTQASRHELAGRAQLRSKMEEAREKDG